MKKNQPKKKAYTAPQCELINVENERFICVSVRPNAGTGSGTVPWEEKNHEGGTIFFGDESSVAPAKEGWFDEE